MTRTTKPTVTVKRYFSTEGVHPYDEVEWEARDVVQTNWKTGEVIFEQRGVEFPTFWSTNASTIVTTKYFRGILGTPEREASLRTIIDRVVGAYVRGAIEHKYMDSANAAILRDELTWLLLHQYFSFNSPVWFNIGTKGRQQSSACFILSVDDSMESILNWYTEEGMIFKGGSGAGLNLSNLRSSKELLSSGGTASGPISFMRGADASAGTIKSGGANRRAAKMVVLDIDHPDIEEFIELKAREEQKIRALRDAGFDMDLNGRDISSVQYQNANNSVRLTDEFMQAVTEGAPFGLKSRTTGEVIETVDAASLWMKLAKAAWECADPGVQYDTTINSWHTCSNSGRINASNPCSEFMHLDNTSCNLASLNLMKFVTPEDTFDIPSFTAAVETIITAMDISIAFSDFPTVKITENTRKYRQLGIGYANLGALLMSSGLAYDSAEARAVAGAITSLMSAVSYRRSAEIAAVMGAYDGYAENAEPHTAVLNRHQTYAEALTQAVKGAGGQFVAPGIVSRSLFAAPVAEAGVREWETGNTLGAQHGWRNSQVSVLAPTGTISFMLDCDTTGIEPDFSLVKFKKMVDGSSLRIINTQVPPALKALGYGSAAIEEITAYIMEKGSVVGAPGLRADHYPVFDCAVGDRAISPMGHIYMMAAAQPFLSGAISKTVNLPQEATVEDIAEVYYEGWALGLKAIAVYRDNCKVGQPLSDGKAKKATEPVAPATVIVEVPRAARRRLPAVRTAKTRSFQVGGAEGYLTIGEYDDGNPGEMFIKMSKQGSTLAGIMDGFAIAVSLGLQYGVPLEAYVEKFASTRFEPAGMTNDKDIRMGQSILDYIARRLALDYLPYDTRSAHGIFTTAERTAALEAEYATTEPETVQQDEIVKPYTAPAPTAPAHTAKEETHGHSLNAVRTRANDAPLCLNCGTQTVYTGACAACPSCGTTTGCS